MAVTLNRLNARSAQTKGQGIHSDGAGLFLSVKEGGRRWIYRFRWEGKQTELALGSANKVSLARAREFAAQARDALARGVHPKQARDEARAAAKPQPAPAPKKTFGECADEYLANLDGSFRNAKHAAQWKMTLTKYAAPLRDIPVAEVTTENVVEVIKPLWRTKQETASRLRGRIERVLSYAKVMGHRSGENPAMWRGHLQEILSKRELLSRGHHAALPYVDLPAFMVRLRGRSAVAARALEFAILTAARSGEVIGAKWAEMDLDRAVWIVPGARMKAGREHRVPLSGDALAVLRAMADLRTMADGREREHVFPAQGRDEERDVPLSNMGMAMLLRRLEVPITVHGFRSTFRDWAAECTHTPNEVCEAALAHVIGNKAEAAYRRGDLFEKRRELMNEWARYCAGQIEESST